LLHGVSKWRLDKLLGSTQTTFRNQKKRQKGTLYETPRLETVRLFLEDYFSNGILDVKPNPAGGKDIWNLPAVITATALYNTYVASFKNTHSDENPRMRTTRAPSYATFLRGWKAHYPHVKTPAQDRFSKCMVCNAHEIIIKGPDHSPGEKLAEQAKLDAHYRFVDVERKFVNSALWKSIVAANDLFFFEIDSMDSSKTLLPHFQTKDKEVIAEYQLKVHLCCVKYNGRRPNDVYYYTNVLPHDGSNTCTVIWLTLLKVISLSPDFCAARLLLKQTDHGCVRKKSKTHFVETYLCLFLVVPVIVSLLHVVKISKSTLFRMKLH
jgi:hypothetical protein